MRYVRRKYACDIGALQVLAGAIEALVTGYALPLRAVSPLEGGDKYVSSALLFHGRCCLLH